MPQAPPDDRNKRSGLKLARSWLPLSHCIRVAISDAVSEPWDAVEKAARSVLTLQFREPVSDPLIAAAGLRTTDGSTTAVLHTIPVHKKS